MIATLSSWSRLPIAPNIIAPRHSSLTLTPVFPNVLLRIAADSTSPMTTARSWVEGYAGLDG